MSKTTTKKKTAASKNVAPQVPEGESKLKFLPFIILGVLIIALTMGNVKPRSPEEAGKLFCTASNHSTVVKQMFTPELRAAWEEAETKNKAWAKAHPGEKPPFGDGIPIAGFPDAAPVCETGKTTENGVEIHHNFPDQPKSNWTDRLVLKKAENAYWIDDIQFAPRGTLRKTLKSAF